MMLSTFRADTLSSSLVFLSNTKPLHGPLSHRPLQHTPCDFHGSFGVADSTIFTRRSAFECTLKDRWRGGNNRHFSTVCKSYGENDRESSEGSRRYEMLNEEPPPCRRKFDLPGNSNRKAARVGNGYGPSQTIDRRPGSLRRSIGTLEGFGREPSPGNSYQGTESFRRHFPAFSDYRVATSFGGYGRPRREYPVRADRLHEVVSANYGAHPSFGNLSSSVASPVSHGHLGRDLTNFPFKNATVSVFWDLDNKPPTSSPYHAAVYLRDAASQFGSVVDMVAYANHHAFTHIPNWVREQRRDRKDRDILEQRGLLQPEQPYVCALCGRKCRTNVLLKKHFKELHEREHNKRMSRLNSLKGKKKDKYRAAMLPKTHKYKEAASPILVPKVGYGLESDLRRAGIFVKTVQYKPQAADIALKKQIADSIHNGIKCICLVSDDMDFARMLADARALNLRTIVFGESRSLKRCADFWFPWEDICRGVPAQVFQESIQAWALYQDSVRKRDLEILAGVHNVDLDVEHKVFGGHVSMQKPRFSAFSEEEPILEQDAYGSASDDEWSFDDEDGEFDDESEDDGDDDGLV